MSGSFSGIAGDIDWTNDNRTDIAFARPVGGSTVAEMAQREADVALHEAGHTFGLCHVNSPNTREAMGMGYSAGTRIGMDVSFLNQTFPEYQDHCLGERTQQNSHQHMNSVFVTGSDTLAGDAMSHGASGLHWDDILIGAVLVESHEHQAFHEHQPVGRPHQTHQTFAGLIPDLAFAARGVQQDYRIQADAWGEMLHAARPALGNLVALVAEDHIEGENAEHHAVDPILAEFVTQAVSVAAPQCAMGWGASPGFAEASLEQATLPDAGHTDAGESLTTVWR
jgi:thiamine phosphate synthase YjbQ (UPF0047 family)